jgi:hypothetical protein
MGAALPALLFSQAEIFGHYESEVDGARIGGTDYSFGYNKLRVDLQAFPAQEVTVGANVNIRRYHGKTNWNIFDFLPDSLWQPFFGENATWIFALRDTLYLDNVYLKARFKHFDLTVGKQQISLGTGYAWNPTDIFNIKDLMDPTYEQTGVTAIRAEVPFGDRMLADIIYSPKEGWEESPQFIRFKLGIGSFDLTASVGQFRWERTGLNLTTLQPLIIRTSRNLYGGSAVGQIWEIGMWAEGAWNELSKGDDFAEYVIGVDHTFDFQTYLMMEYYHNGSGTESDSLTINDYMYSLGGQTHSLMQDYLFVLANHPISDVLSAGLMGIANLNDESFAINPLLDWNAFENVSVSLFLSKAVGEDDTEFGLQEWAWRVRVRAYF